ncbi:hypothetical protein ROZALSC1DRAFT_30071 [Rozella allomycis CSF55]|uniref:Uncharacterized protein n=1 Tax=Rozella allomycis (strain CSF55) TaxID=988480 RepID=A0A4P9YG16_ROZAC|nr:hypothetical protein ROZALSC1DRAFT_30071 [Rozella allomycis CSF55]
MSDDVFSAIMAGIATEETINMLNPYGIRSNVLECIYELPISFNSITVRVPCYVVLRQRIYHVEFSVLESGIKIDDLLDSDDYLLAELDFDPACVNRVGESKIGQKQKRKKFH